MNSNWLKAIFVFVVLGIVPTAHAEQVRVSEIRTHGPQYFTLLSARSLKIGLPVCKLNGQEITAGLITKLQRKNATWTPYKILTRREERRGRNFAVRSLRKAELRATSRCHKHIQRLRSLGVLPEVTPTATNTPTTSETPPAVATSTPQATSTSAPVSTIAPTPTATFTPTPSPSPTVGLPSPDSFAVFDQSDEVNLRLSWRDSSSGLNESAFVVQRERQVSNNSWGNPVQWEVPANSESAIDAAGTGVFRYRIAARYGQALSVFSSWVVASVSSGWTTFTPSADSRVVYVSSSLGNDSNSGFSESAPKRTIAAGVGLLRDGYPDWLLLRRGDYWQENLSNNWDKNGRSAAEPLVISAYGPVSSPRPVLEPGNAALLYHNPGGNLSFSNIAVVSIHGIGNGTRTGIDILGGGTNFHIEDCLLERFTIGIVLQGDVTTLYQGIRVRRNVVADSYSLNSHSQGIYAARIQNLVLEENTFDHNGWNEGVADPTIFNHNIYLQPLAASAVVRGNISARASSHGAQMRGGATCENNLFVQNSLALFVANNPSTVRYNVVLEAKDISPSLRRGYGISTLEVPGASIRYNILAHKLTTAEGSAFEVAHEPDFAGVPYRVTLEDNVVYRWDGVNVRISHPDNQIFNRIEILNNRFQRTSNSLVDHWPATFDGTRFVYAGNRYDTQSSFWRLGSAALSFGAWSAIAGESGSSVGPSVYPDPERSVASYHASIGGTASLEAFLTEARLQRKGYWRPQYTAAAVNSYIRAGFGVSDPP